MAARPSERTPDQVGLFDRFASVTAGFAAKPWFFAMCLLLVLLWAPSVIIIGDVDTWQLIINTVTTIVTFLLVALLQNTQTRADKAVQDKLNAIADALADLMRVQAGEERDLRREIAELKSAVGLEERETA